MPTYHYDRISAQRTRSGKCPTCGKRRTVSRVLRPPVELRRPELAEVGLGGVVARGIREGA